MTEQDIKRIEEESKRTFDPYNNAPPRAAFQIGAEYEHPIAHKEGWNEAIETILTDLMQKWSKKDVSEIYDEIEKLKK